MSTRRLAALAVLGCLTACQPDALPPRVTIEDVVRVLAPPLGDDAAVDAPAPDAVRTGILAPGHKMSGNGPRPSLIALPPATVRFRVEVPPDAVLRFSLAVAGTQQREPDRSGVAFRVLVDGEAEFVEHLNPAERRRHRQWADGAVDLSRHAGRSVDVVLETRADAPDLPLAGTPGWSHVRLVRRATRERVAARPGAPNLLVLLVDTLRADRVGIYGAHPSPTPTLDALAAGGTVFENAVSQSSWTLPSVASLFTGLHPRTHGTPGMATAGGDPETRGRILADALLTWAELAQHAGITTVGVSANPLVTRATNLAQGFEAFEELPWDGARFDWRPASDINRRFLEWLETNRDWRFVAYLHYMEPHDPYDPPAALRPPPPAGIRPGVASGRITPLAKAVNFRGAPGLSATELTYVRELYDADVRAWDQSFAALLQGLAAARVLDDTTIVVLADHGEEFQEHGRLKHGSHLYEESIRVPLIIAGPGVPVARRGDVAQGIDLYPTLAALLGLTPPPGLPGRDLLATHVAGDAVLETASGFGSNGAPTDVVALRTPQWKLIRTPDIGRVELYDLERDPREQSAASDGSEITSLTDRLDRWAAAAPPPPAGAGTVPALRAKLRQLGYIE